MLFMLDFGSFPHPKKKKNTNEFHQKFHNLTVYQWFQECVFHLLVDKNFYFPSWILQFWIEIQIVWKKVRNILEMLNHLAVFCHP